MKLRKVLILNGDGINSENELRHCFVHTGAKVELLHVNNLLKNPKKLNEFDFLALPGGFSFGDELRSGKILAEKIKQFLSIELKEFIEKDKKVLGICNGFQIMMQLGLFNTDETCFSLVQNRDKKFINKWTKFNIPADSLWFKGSGGKIFLPIRHGEGRLICSGELNSNLNSQINYAEDLNGSLNNIAGMTNDKGNLFGLMPHPEVATYHFLHPFSEGAKENANKVKQFFINAVQ